MSVQILDEREVAAAIKAALDATLAPHSAWDHGTAPGDPMNPVEAERNKPLPSIFVLLGVEDIYVEPTHSSGGTATRCGVRFTCVYVGRTAKEARWAKLQTDRAVKGQRLVVGDLRSTRVRRESSRAIALDDGRFSGHSIYTCGF